MVITGIPVLCCYLFVWVLARMERKRRGIKTSRPASLLSPFRSIAEWYLGRKQAISLNPAGRSTQSFVSHSVLEDLQKLEYGAQDSRLAENYYIEKLSAVLAIVFTGTLLCTLLSVQAQSQGQLSEDGTILRGDYREEKKQLELEAQADGLILPRIQLEVSGRRPERAVADELEEHFWQELCSVALGDNPSAQEVRTDLKLHTQLEGYPFTVQWESPDPLLLASDGTVKVLTKEQESATIELTARVTYEDWKWEHLWTLTILPPLLSEEEQILQELERYLQQLEAQSRGEEMIELPANWHGRELVWRECLEDYGLLLWMMVLVTGGAVFYMKDRDLHARVLKQQETIRAAYPAISNKLLLYLSAGLTTRSALERMAQEYLSDRQNGGELQPAYEAIVHTCRELRTGISEMEAYEHLGKRCGTQEYIRLGALLSRNLKKGSGALLTRLREENENAVRERAHRSRQLGEEASTRLLMPMMIMLGIVMVVIMVPAFGAM